jgi:hypothetical protein
MYNGRALLKQKWKAADERISVTRVQEDVAKGLWPPRHMR